MMGVMNAAITPTMIAKSSNLDLVSKLIVRSSLARTVNNVVCVADRWIFLEVLPATDRNCLDLGHVSSIGVYSTTQSGLASWNRTNNPKLRRLVLYPVELWREEMVGGVGIEPTTSRI